MIVFRIAKRKRASDISGYGASIFPGRWNKKGTPVLYTGESKEIALLEYIVHIPPMMSPELDILTIDIPNGPITVLTPEDLPPNWYQYPAPTILSEIGQMWIDEGKTLALKVPSSIIHTANNIILNCKHKDFKRVKILSQKKFYFDSRLRK
ncbi:MAG TPA: RES domain-containing protein [Caldithrix abyssi]|uniref:RES domain-containing protein n=1 Tax=Caldithrix abyssi TaxID=187145 RepID=A0A7V4TYC5_CALAY|nr:RES domain-containing protein [Caldithrix abyssi]